MENSTYQPAIITIPEYAQIMRISRNNAYELAARGELPVRIIKCGKKFFIPVAEVEKLLGGPITLRKCDRKCDK